MIRRFLWRNERHIFRRKDSRSGKEIFSGFPPQVAAQIYELSFWNSDKWDPMEYGCEYDFSKPFFDHPIWSQYSEFSTAITLFAGHGTV